MKECRFCMAREKERTFNTPTECEACYKLRTRHGLCKCGRIKNRYGCLHCYSNIRYVKILLLEEDSGRYKEIWRYRDANQISLLSKKYEITYPMVIILPPEEWRKVVR